MATDRAFAFLGGINVGGHRVSNATLVDILTGLGVSGVTSFLASGNLTFEVLPDTPDLDGLADRFEEACAARLGYAVPTWMRTGRELSAVAPADPLAGIERADGDRVHVGFFREQLDSGAVAALEALSDAGNVLRADGRELYWLCHGPISESTVKGPMMSRAAGAPTTMRNLSSVVRLVDRHPPD